jgi:hypothetical protein
MHAAFHLLLPVGTFSVLAVVLYLAYLEPAEVDGVIAALLPGSKRRAHSKPLPGHRGGR